MMTKLTLEQILTLKQQGYTNRQIAREFLGRESRESWIRLQLKRAQENMSEIVGEATERFLEEHKIHQPIVKVPVVDTTAAGDTFTGFFIGSIAKGLSPKEAMQIAAKASAIAVSRQGAAPSIPELKEVYDFDR